MSLRQAFSLIHSDYLRYRPTGGKNEGGLLAIVLLTQGFWASTVYRFSHALIQIRQPALRRILRVVFLFIEKWIEILTGVRIPGECTIGHGLYIGHFGNIILGGKAVIGNNCNLSQGVTIGVVQRGSRQGVPVIGDRVYIGTNAIVIGGIEIGHDAAIGAGAVVTRSVPPLAVIAGNPARILSYLGSFEMVCYSGMDSDPQRLAALEKRSQMVESASEEGTEN